MFGSVMLEICIGVVFIYVLLSIICTTIMELISRAFAMRSHNLESGIRNLLISPSLADDFYRHPLIAKISPKRGWAAPGRGGKPSYIRSRIFALALMDVAAPSDPLSPPRTVALFRRAISTGPHPEITRTMLPLIDDAGDDMRKVRESIEEWFNHAMERVSGWYKRKVQLLVLLLALVISVILNADTLMIANGLSRDATLRGTVVAAVEDAVENDPEMDADSLLTLLTDLYKKLGGMCLPLGWVRPSDDVTDIREFPTGAGGWFLKLLGLGLTTLAVSLGSPFWINVLDRFVSLRSAGQGRTPDTGDGAKKAA